MTRLDVGTVGCAVVLLACAACEVGDVEPGECPALSEDDVQDVVTGPEPDDDALACGDDTEAPEFLAAASRVGTGCGGCPAGSQRIAANGHTMTFCSIPAGHRAAVLYLGRFLVGESSFNSWNGRRIAGALCRNSFGSDVTWTVFPVGGP